MDPFYAAALRFAREHGYRGDELPCGIRGEPDHCPLAHAIGAFIDGETWTKSVGEGGWLSESVQAFVCMFDKGHYPELIEKDSEPLPAVDEVAV